VNDGQGICWTFFNDRTPAGRFIHYEKYLASDMQLGKHRETNMKKKENDAACGKPDVIN
jgi:hypothetical protein